jgi:hypothetical protein
MHSVTVRTIHNINSQFREWHTAVLEESEAGQVEIKLGAGGSNAITVPVPVFLARTVIRRHFFLYALLNLQANRIRLGFRHDYISLQSHHTNPKAHSGVRSVNNPLQNNALISFSGL